MGEQSVRDVVVIGAGISGATVARELMRHKLSVEVLEAGYDLACGASRTNSGIIHGGYDPVPGTKKAKYNVEGARMAPQLAAELGFRYKNTGSLVVAFADDEVPAVQELVERGHANGVDDVRYVEREELHTLEPNLSEEAVGALLCESSGIVDPFGMTVAFAENAVTNGATFTFNTRVEKIEREGDEWVLTLADGTMRRAKTVVNAAGVHAIDLHNQVSAEKLGANPRRGDYELMSRDMGPVFSHTMFQVPNALGKGVLVSPTVEGNLIVGPNAVAVEDPEDNATTPEGLSWVVEQAKRTWPAYNGREVIVNFAGVRPSGADGDFVIGEPADAPGFFDVAAIDSPGLSSAAAIATDVASWIAERLGAEENPSFDGHREMPPRTLEMTEDEIAALIEENPLYGRLVCRCERVSEAEVLNAIHAPIPATTIVGVKRRCRAGAGRCQGGFCEPVVTEILARELGCRIQDICIGGPGSEVAPFTREEVRA